VNHTSNCGPELSQNTEKRTLTASVGASNHQVHALFDLEAHLSDKSISVGGNNRHIGEDDVFGLDESGFTLQVLETDNFVTLLLLTGAVSIFIGRDHNALVSTNLEVFKDVIHLVDERSVTSEGLDFFVRDNKSSNSFSQVDQKRTVLNVVTGDGGSVAFSLSEVLGSFGSEYGETNNGVTNHSGSVLNEHGIKDTHQEFLTQDHVGVSVKSVEASINVLLLPLLTIVESDFFRVSKELIVQVTVLALKLLLDSGHSSEGRGDSLDNETRKTVPCENHSGTFPSNELSQLSAEENDIKDRLGKVHVEAGKRSSPFLGVSSKALVRVTDSAVQITDLVVVHVLQVLRVEVQSKASSEPERQLLLEVVEAGVDGG